MPFKTQSTQNHVNKTEIMVFVKTKMIVFDFDKQFFNNLKKANLDKLTMCTFVLFRCSPLTSPFVE